MNYSPVTSPKDYSPIGNAKNVRGIFNALFKCSLEQIR